MNSIQTRFGKTRVVKNGEKYRIERGDDCQSLKGERWVNWLPITGEISLSDVKEWFKKELTVWAEVDIKEFI